MKITHKKDSSVEKGTFCCSELEALDNPELDYFLLSLDPLVLGTAISEEEAEATSSDVLFIHSKYATYARTVIEMKYCPFCGKKVTHKYE
jgi:CRISPR/Cas system endoribonuclease Cas6 (RAMP superfamily)